MVTPAKPPAPKFRLGTVVATPGALSAMAGSNENAATFLARHVIGDWGDVSPEDAIENDRSVQQGSRILSAYTLSDRTRIWAITEADRSSTCLLLPEEY